MEQHNPWAGAPATGRRTEMGCEAFHRRRFRTRDESGRNCTPPQPLSGPSGGTCPQAVSIPRGIRVGDGFLAGLPGVVLACEAERCRPAAQYHAPRDLPCGSGPVGRRRKRRGTPSGPGMRPPRASSTAPVAATNRPDGWAGPPKLSAGCSGIVPCTKDDNPNGPHPSLGTLTPGGCAVASRLGIKAACGQKSCSDPRHSSI